MPGVVQAVQAAKDQGYGVIVPRANAAEVEGLFDDYKPVYYVNHLDEAIAVVNTLTCARVPGEVDEQPEHEGWWDRITGQNGAKRALEIAAAGGHPVFMMGAPGSSKTALAKAMLDILPPMTEEETLEVAKIYSVAGKYEQRQRPFRAPHASASMAALLGGGWGEGIKPGEVSLAHNGVLYLDEFAEYPKVKYEALRGPLEDGKVVISRLKSKVEYPARFQLVVGTNPCPCGYYGEGDRCTCTTGQRVAYLSRMSGPVFDRLTVQVWVHPDVSGTAGEPAAVVAERVRKARELQMKRQGKLNDELSSQELAQYVPTNNEVLQFAETIVERLGLSARAWSRMLKIAMTIADLEGAESVRTEHIAEAASYRFLDRTQVL